jgi:hypothetical protein
MLAIFRPDCAIGLDRATVVTEALPSRDRARVRRAICDRPWLDGSLPDPGDHLARAPAPDRHGMKGLARERRARGHRDEEPPRYSRRIFVSIHMR